MVAMGYMAEITAKAAKEVAMNAGARVMGIISSDTSPEDSMSILKDTKADIILLAGGTDGGEGKSALKHAQLIVKSKSAATVVIACNKDIQKEVAAYLDSAFVPNVQVANIMPAIHKLNVQPAREAIHQQFIRQITRIKGLERLEALLADNTLVPTPGAVLMACELLAKGTYRQKGEGPVALIDLGGATTDIHSAIPEFEKVSFDKQHLVVENQKHFSHRTVEGNLGLRISATDILETAGPYTVIDNIPGHPSGITAEKLSAYTQKLAQTPSHIPQNQEEKAMDKALATTAIAIALRRHAGRIAKEENLGMNTSEEATIGRDLRYLKRIYVSGGIFCHLSEEESKEILIKAFENPGLSLLPTAPSFYFDPNYTLYAMGVLSRHFPDPVFSYLKMLRMQANITGKNKIEDYHNGQ